MSMLLSLVNSAMVNRLPEAVVDTNLHNVQMTSEEISELTGKRHDNVMADIRRMLRTLGKEAPEFSGTSTYIQESNNSTHTRQIFILPGDLADTLTLGYDTVRRHRVVQELNRKTEALRRIRDESTTLEEAKGVAAMALTATARNQVRANHVHISNAIDENKETLHLKKGFEHSTVQNLACAHVLGINATSLEKLVNMKPRDWLLENVMFAELMQLDRVLSQMEILIETGASYQDLKARFPKKEASVLSA